MFHHGSRKCIYFGVKASKVKVIKYKNQCRRWFLHSCECWLLLIQANLFATSIQTVHRVSSSCGSSLASRAQIARKMPTLSRILKVQTVDIYLRMRMHQFAAECRNWWRSPRTLSDPTVPNSFSLQCLPSRKSGTASGLGSLRENYTTLWLGLFWNHIGNYATLWIKVGVAAGPPKPKDWGRSRW